MANNFMTLDRAKKEIMRLQDYVDLVESYQPKSIDQEIVKEYALTSSINEVSKRLSVSYEKVVEVISSLGKDELHKMVRSAYMKKTKHSRSWY
ncbi:hypothetical protein P5G62_015235 [Neobacillus sp. 179-C4.2 HS]|uniref:Uncharacterized protein n=1 Tax=Neobacillus driksii TaxID=3035913 RepID=A0ABV4YUE0_9BACI|nr:hypothetical protein [Neobacillus sp. 179.-C4.2 HS]